MARIEYGLLGFVLGLAAFYLLSVLRPAPSWLTHAVALGVVVAGAAIAWRHRKELTRGNAVALGIAVAFLAGTGVSIESARRVAAHAMQTAADTPHCIQVAHAGDYEPAGSLLDLSGLTMWATSQGGMRFQHHAVLVVEAEPEPQLFHWSYRQQQFVPRVVYQRGVEPALGCVPKRNFVGNLPVMFPLSSDSRYVRFSRHETYRIPAAYQPRWSSSRTLRLAAAAPDFAPLNVSWDALAPDERDSNWVFIQWNPEWLHSLISSTKGQTTDLGMEFGLNKRVHVFRGKDGKSYESFRYLTDAPPGGSGETLIGCGAATEKFPRSCQHRFLNGEQHIYFRHRPEDLPGWRQMQQRILDLLASFQAAAAAPSGR